MDNKKNKFKRISENITEAEKQISNSFSSLPIKKYILFFIGLVILSNILNSKLSPILEKKSDNIFITLCFLIFLTFILTSLYSVFSTISYRLHLHFLKTKGKTTTATITDFLTLYKLERLPSEHHTSTYQKIYNLPVLSFWGPDNEHHIQISPISVETNKQKFEIGNSVQIYYKESEPYEQLNFDKKIFLGISYPELSTISNDELIHNQEKNIFARRIFDQKINSKLYDDKIENFPLSTIKRRDIFIEGSSNSIYHLPTLILQLLIFIIIFSIIAFIFYLAYKSNFLNIT